MLFTFFVAFCCNKTELNWITVFWAVVEYCQHYSENTVALIELIQSYWPGRNSTETVVPLWTDPELLNMHRPEASEGQGGISLLAHQGFDPLPPDQSPVLSL